MAFIFCKNAYEPWRLKMTKKLFFLLALLPLLGLPALVEAFEAGYYHSDDENNPGNFLFAGDGSGLFATEEYIAYFKWREEGKRLVLVFQKGLQDDSTLKMDLSGPDSFTFEKFGYTRLKNGNVEKYSLVDDSRQGSLLLVSSGKAPKNSSKVYIFINIRDNKTDKFCEIEALCKQENGLLACHDNFARRRQGGKITLKDWGSEEITLQSTISGSHNYTRQCDYNGTFRVVK